MDVSSETGRHTVFSIFFPCHKQKDPVINLKEFSEDTVVLVIDDEQIIRDASKLILEQKGIRVLSAAGGREGVDLYKNNSKEIDIVILDMMMPDKNGKEVFEEIHQVSPSAKIIVSSGYCSPEDVSFLKACVIANFMKKPYTASDLIDAVAEAL